MCTNFKMSTNLKMSTSSNEGAHAHSEKGGGGGSTHPSEWRCVPSCSEVWEMGQNSPFLSLWLLYCIDTNFFLFWHVLRLHSSFLPVILILIQAIIFGIKKEDRQWVPRPDQNYLSWAYGFFIISAFFTLFSAITLLLASRELKKKLKMDYPDRRQY